MNTYTSALKGVHIDVSLPITRLGQPENFQDVEFLEIRFVNNRLSDQLVVYTADKIKLTDNVVSVVIPDTDSSRLQLGFYDVQFTYRKTNVLRPNQYEPFKLVVPAFSLVATTAELGVDIANDVEVQSVVINGELFIARDGLNGASAFQIWQMAVGTPESTVLDYLAWLRQPAESAATEFEALTDQFNAFNAAANEAENTRNTKETERNENESIRLVDEQLRKNAESARVLAEQTRQQNESDRETLFDQSVSESAQATAAANTAAAAANAAANAQNAYNVTVAVPLAAGVYYTKTTARAAVPVASRKIGLVNTYALSASTWYTEKYIGSNVSGWTTESNWEQVPDAAKLSSLETDFINAVNSLANNIGYDLGLGKKTDDTYRLLNIIGKRTGYVGYLDNYTLHGFEYTPGQNDDIVTLIGNTNYNTNKPIQSQMRPFEELISTKERFYLRDDVTKRIDGSASNLTDQNYLQKVYIPEFWYGAMFDSVRNKIQLWFSLIPVTGFMHIAPQAVCRYPGYVDGTGKARSHSGYKYPNNKNLIEFTTACQLTSTDLFVLPYYTYNALSLLLLHDIGRRNAQAVWAGLQSGSTYSKITSGKTDVLTTPSGEVSADAETASSKPFRWRFIENLYGDCWKILSGVYCNQVGADRRVMVCPDPYKANTSSVISADYIQACIIAAGEGWLKDINAPWINAKAYGASSTTGYSDYTYNNTADKTIMLAGGHSYNGAFVGPFDLTSTTSASNRSIYLGALFASIDQNKAATQIVKPSLIY